MFWDKVTFEQRPECGENKFLNVVKSQGSDFSVRENKFGNV